MVCPWSYEIIIRIDFFCVDHEFCSPSRRRMVFPKPRLPSVNQCSAPSAIYVYFCVLAGSEPSKNRSLSSLVVCFRHAYHKIWIFSRFIPISFSFSFSSSSRSYLCPVFEALFLFVCSAFFLFFSFHFNEIDDYSNCVIYLINCNILLT